MVNPPFYDKIVRAVPANWKEAIQEREVCTLDDNCYVSVNGDKLELQNLGHKELYKALVTKKNRQINCPQEIHRHIQF